MTGMSYQNLQRLAYADGMFLDATMMQIEQSYFIDKLQYLVQGVFNGGILPGTGPLGKAGFPLQDAQQWTLTVGQGVAIDGQGNLLVWAGGQVSIPPSQLTDGQIYDVYMGFAPPPPSGSYVFDQPSFQVLPPPPANPPPYDKNLVIGKVKYSKAGSGSLQKTAGQPKPVLVTLKVQPEKTTPIQNQQIGFSGQRAGSVSIPIAANQNDVSSLVPVTFEKRAFSEPPAIQLTAQTSRGDRNLYAVLATDVTPKGFAVLLENLKPLKNAKAVRVNWQARQN